MSNMKISEYEIRRISWKSVISDLHIHWDRAWKQSVCLGLCQRLQMFHLVVIKLSVQMGKGIIIIIIFLSLMLVIMFINILKVHLKMKFQRMASLLITHADRPIFDMSFLMD